MSESLLQAVVRRYGVDALVELFSTEQLNSLRYQWRALARPEQLAPEGVWSTWLFLAGRGCGKTRSLAEWSREQAQEMPGSHGALVAPTAADARDVMVKALLECTPGSEGLAYEPSRRLMRWANGTTATLYSAEEPDRLRGPQHHWAWCDELAAWQYAGETWDMLQMTMRLGEQPRVVASTTPRPIPLIRVLLKDPAVAVTRGSTFDNAANLSQSFLETVRKRYEGTRLGRQELYAEVLDDVPGALWQRDDLDKGRLRRAPELKRVVVAIDPAITSGEDSDETGIVVAGIGEDGTGYVLEDCSCRESPDRWARIAVDAYHRYKADRIIAERNQGGDMVEHTIRTVDRRVSYESVVAKRGKFVRAEPVAALYEQGRVHHAGSFPALEDQMCRYVPDGFDGSPDRVDALVWAITALMVGEPVPDYDDLGPSGFGRRM